MRCATSLGQGGGSNDSPPRLPPAGDTGSLTAAEWKASQSELYQLGCSSGTRPVDGRWPRPTKKAIALDPDRVPDRLRKAAEVSEDHRPIAVRVREKRSSAHRASGEVMRTAGSNVICGRPVAVPDSNRRSAGPWKEFETDSPGGLSRRELPVSDRAAPCGPREPLQTSAAGQHQISCGRGVWAKRREPPPLDNLWACPPKRQVL